MNDKTQSEHNESGVHLLADIGADIDLGREGPGAEVDREFRMLLVGRRPPEMRGKNNRGPEINLRESSTQIDLDVQAVVALRPNLLLGFRAIAFSGMLDSRRDSSPFAGREHIVGFFEECVHEASAHRGSHPHYANLPSELLIGDGNFGE